MNTCEKCLKVHTEPFIEKLEFIQKQMDALILHYNHPMHDHNWAYHAHGIHLEINSKLKESCSK